MYASAWVLGNVPCRKTHQSNQPFSLLDGEHPVEVAAGDVREALLAGCAARGAASAQSTREQ